MSLLVFCVNIVLTWVKFSFIVVLINIFTSGIRRVQYAFEELGVLILQLLKRRSLVGLILQPLLKKLESGSIVLQDLGPTLHPDRGHIAFENSTGVQWVL